MTSELDFDFPVANLRPPPHSPIIPSVNNRILGLMAVTGLPFSEAQGYILLADKTGRTAIDLWAESIYYPKEHNERAIRHGIILSGTRLECDSNNTRTESPAIGEVGGVSATQAND